MYMSFDFGFAIPPKCAISKIDCYIKIFPKACDSLPLCN